MLLPGQPEAQTGKKLNGVGQSLAVLPEQFHGCRLSARVILEAVRDSAVPAQQAPQILERAEGTQVEMMTKHVAQIL